VAHINAAMAKATRRMVHPLGQLRRAEPSVP
jgi:hypothetical protein